MIPIGPPPMATLAPNATVPHVFLALPSYGRQVDVGHAKGAYQWPTAGRCKVTPREKMGSCCPDIFNLLWDECINERATAGYTHAAILHTDVEPEPFWLDIGLAEMNRLDADVISTVIPIKDRRGVTTTALKLDDSGHYRRLCMRELVKLPWTFDAKGAGFPNGTLLVNTGCILFRLGPPWMDALSFHYATSRVQGKNGQWSSLRGTEDWIASLYLAMCGTKVYATRKITVNHWGLGAFNNKDAWGDWETDREYQP